MWKSRVTSYEVIYNCHSPNFPAVILDHHTVTCYDTKIKRGKSEHEVLER